MFHQEAAESSVPHNARVTSQRVARSNQKLSPITAAMSTRLGDIATRIEGLMAVMTLEKWSQLKDSLKGFLGFIRKLA